MANYIAYDDKIAAGGNFSGTAATVEYDNTTSGLTATNTQSAIDELASNDTTKVSKSGDTMTGDLYINLQNGTTASNAYSVLTLGNSIPVGTAKNSTGILDLYSDSGNRVRFYTVANVSGTRYIQLPNSTGIVALTQDIDNRTNGNRAENELYVTNDTHIMKICTITLGDYFSYLTLFITSSFWGNQHGSADIINIQNSIGSSTAQYNIERTHLAGVGGNGGNRIFFHSIDGNNLSLYVYVTGGNSYGAWNCSVLRQVNVPSITYYWYKNQTLPSGYSVISSTAVQCIDGTIYIGEYGDTTAAPGKLFAEYIEIGYKTGSQKGIAFHYGNGQFYCRANYGFNFRDTNNNYVPLYASAFTVQSSRRYKTNIEDMTNEDALSLLQLRPVTFDYIEESNGINCKGLIAEEVADVDDFTVSYDDENIPSAIDYSKFTPQLIKLCQIQQNTIDSLTKRLEALEKIVLNK